MSWRRSSLAFTVIRHGLLLTGACLVLLPFAWALSVAAKPTAELFDPTWSILPRSWALFVNFGRATARAPILQYLVNGFIVCGGIFVFQLIVCVPRAYALALLDWRGRQTTFALVIVGLLLPQQALAIPQALLLHRLGLVDTYAALVLPSVASVFRIFLLRQFFRTIPRELIDSARLDGMSDLGIITRVVLPISGPAILAFGIFSLVLNWNDLHWPMIVVRSAGIATPPLGLLLFMSSKDGSDYATGPMAGLWHSARRSTP